MMTPSTNSPSTITVPLNGLLPEVHVEVTDMVGSRLHSVNITEQKESIDIDISGFSVGLYIVKIQFNNGSGIMTKFSK